MIKSLEESIVTQAIKDLSNKKDFERESAILFFVENDHLHYCKQAGIDGVELRKKCLSCYPRMVQDVVP
jgi:hypothetical protein